MDYTSPTHFHTGASKIAHTPELFWDATYAIALALIEMYPDKPPEGVGLNEMAAMIEQLPGFCDDPALATERILMDIQIVWYEETVN